MIASGDKIIKKIIPKTIGLKKIPSKYPRYDQRKCSGISVLGDEIDNMTKIKARHPKAIE